MKVIVDFWHKNFKKYFFKYKKGFFESSVFANSPEILIKNLVSLPFVKHDKDKQLISTSNPFMSLKLFYEQLEEGLELIITAPSYKKNVIENLMYFKDIPVEHYMLSYRITKKNVKVNNHSLVNGAAFPSYTWCLSKPKGANQFCHFKNTNEFYFALYFTKDWLENFLHETKIEVKLFFEKFQNSDTSFIFWPDANYKSETVNQLIENVITSTNPKNDVGKEMLLEHAKQMMTGFTTNVNKVVFLEGIFKLSNELRLNILKAENLLSNYFNTSFPGLHVIAEKVGISETNLKNGFRTVFGNSVYKHYRKKKMNLSFAILQKNPTFKIEKLAYQMGYKNASKFAAAFKEEMGISPSDIEKKLKSN